MINRSFIIATARLRHSLACWRPRFAGPRGTSTDAMTLATSRDDYRLGRATGVEMDWWRALGIPAATQGNRDDSRADQTLPGEDRCHYQSDGALQNGSGKAFKSLARGGCQRGDSESGCGRRHSAWTDTRN